MQAERSTNLVGPWKEPYDDTFTDLCIDGLAGDLEDYAGPRSSIKSSSECRPEEEMVHLWQALNGCRYASAVVMPRHELGKHHSSMALTIRFFRQMGRPRALALCTPSSNFAVAD